MYGICWLKAIMFIITYEIQFFYINLALEVLLNVAPTNIVGAEALEYSIGLFLHVGILYKERLYMSILLNLLILIR